MSAMSSSRHAAFCAATPVRAGNSNPRFSAAVCRRRPRACAEATPADEAVDVVAPPTAETPLAGAGASYVDVPGKIQLTADELSAQKQRLDRLEEEFKQERLVFEYEQSRKFGFVEFAETLNGRLAMMFFVTGLLT